MHGLILRQAYLYWQDQPENNVNTSLAAIARALGSANAANHRREVLLTMTKGSAGGWRIASHRIASHRIASHRTSGSPLALRGSVVQGWRAGRPGRAPVTRPFVARRSLSRNIRIVARPGDCTRRRARSTSASVDTNNFEQHSMMICPFFLTLLQRTSLTP